MDLIKNIEELTQLDGVSGNEGEIRNFISEGISKYCDEVFTDAMGNLIAHKKGSGKRLMFAAHMDEIGIIVTDIDDKGFLKFSSVGGLNTRNLVNLKVRFSNGTTGVIGADEEAFKEKASLSSLYLDIGKKNRKEAEKKVSIGDTAAFVGDFLHCGDNIVSKALDNRVGCAVIMQAAGRINKTENDLYFVFTVQEEIGLRGAKTAAFDIEPDIAVAVDVTDTGDTPNAPVMAVKLGGGAAIKVMDRSIMCDADVRCKMTEIAIKNKMAYQLEIMTDGGTDAGAIHLTRAGVKTGGVSIPTRYIHSPSEMANIKDIEDCAELIYLLAVSEW